MNALAAILAVMLLTEPDRPIDAAEAAAVSADADRVDASGAAGAAAADAGDRALRVRSRRSAFDRQTGVVLFEGNALVEYGRDCTMAAERVYVFFAGTNALSRIVAVGDVAITNDLRTGSCATAVYRRKTGVLEMYGEGERLARLSEGGAGSDVLAGERIRFRLDSEQVDVDRPQIEMRAEGKRGVL